MRILFNQFGKFQPHPTVEIKDYTDCRLENPIPIGFAFCAFIYHEVNCYRVKTAQYYKENDMKSDSYLLEIL